MCISLSLGHCAVDKRWKENWARCEDGTCCRWQSLAILLNGPIDFDRPRICSSSARVK